MKQQSNTTVASSEPIVGKKDIIGSVISVAMQKTVIVEMVHVSRHPLYRKAVKKTKHVAAHVENIELVVGDKVKLQETKPISKTKHFRVIEKITK